MAYLSLAVKAFFSQILFSLGIPHPLCFILFLLLVYQSYSECHVTFTDQPFLMNTGCYNQKVKGITGQFFFIFIFFFIIKGNT